MSILWRYSRIAHLVLLLLLLLLYIASWATTNAFYMAVPFGGLYWAMATLGFVFLWLLRGLLALTAVFPEFHYCTLFLEWVAHLIKFAYQLDAHSIILFEGLADVQKSDFSFVIVTLAIVILIDFTYVFLLFKYSEAILFAYLRRI